MRKHRSDYNVKFARSLHDLRLAELSWEEIATNPNYNPKGLTMQRLATIAKKFERDVKLGRVLPHE